MEQMETKENGEDLNPSLYNGTNGENLNPLVNLLDHA